MSGYSPGEQPSDGTRGLVKLNTNENPYPPSPRVLEAVRAAADADLRLYPAPTADRLREAAAAAYGVTPDGVLAGNGSDELLALVLRACVEPGDTVAYATPTYSLYRTLVEAAGAEAREVRAESSRARLAQLARCDARVIFVCNPNSPTGEPLEPEDIGRLADRVDGLVVSDEAYVDFGAKSAIAILEQHPNLLVTRSFSKSFSLAGLRLGLALGGRELIAELRKVKDSYNVSRIALAAGVAALGDRAWMEANVARVCATRERVVRRLREAGYAVPASTANFFWLSCGKEGASSVQARLRKAGVLVRCFDQQGLAAGVRVTVGTEADMDRFLEALLG